MRGKTRTRSGVKKKKKKKEQWECKRNCSGKRTPILCETSKSYEVYVSIFPEPSRAEPNRAVQTLMLKFTSPINPSFRSMHLDSVYLLDQERCCPFRYFDNECVVKPVFRFYPCRANFFRDKKDAANISEHVRGGKS